jgi:hypothetical protein
MAAPGRARAQVLLVLKLWTFDYVNFGSAAVFVLLMPGRVLAEASASMLTFAGRGAHSMVPLP